MKNKKTNIILFIPVIIILVSTYLFYKQLKINNINMGFISSEIIALLLLILITIILLIIYNYAKVDERAKESYFRDKLFKSLIENSDTIYFMYDNKQEELIYITKNISEVLGIKKEKLNENEILSEILAMPILKEELRKWDKNSEFVSQMVSYRSTVFNNQNVWIKVKIYPYQEKKLDGSIILISDVTKEHERQHLLITQAKDIKTREKQLNQITSTSYDVEVNLNVDTNELSLRNLKEGFHYFGENIKGSYESFISIFQQNIFEEDITKVLEVLHIDIFKSAFETNNLEPISIRYRINNKETTWLESTAFFTTNKGEKVVTILTKNVTENAEYMRNQNSLLQKALTEAERANVAKSEFLKTLSHEIRTPMNAIIGLSESVLTEDLSRKAREDADNINSASKNLLDIIDGILDISKVESGILEKNEKEYDLSKLIKDLSNLTIKNLDKKKIKYDVEVNPNLPFRLFGDVTKIRQILSNILNNAVKYTDKGTVKLLVDGEIRTSTVNLIFKVSDTGIGMDKNTLNNLFEKCSNGVGLSIIKKTIDALQGELIVESEINKGSTFTIKIKQKIIADDVIGEVDIYSTTKRINKAFNASDKKVLLVDDNKLNIKVATRLLEPYQINVESVLSGDEAIELIKKDNNYDLILLDQMMPDKDGVQTLKELKQINNFNIPVIVLTADAIVGSKENYLNEGFDDYLSKPIDIKELNQLLTKYLRKEN